jgi:hypothetical protein
LLDASGNRAHAIAETGVEQLGGNMRQRIYPGAQLAVVDIQGVVTCEVPKFGGISQAVGTAPDFTELQRSTPRRDAASWQPADTVVVASGSQSIINIDLYRRDVCCGGLSLVVRSRDAESTTTERPAAAARTRYTSQKIDLDEDSRVGARFLLLRGACSRSASDVDHYARTSALDVTPMENVRLRLDGDGERRSCAVAALGADVADIELSTWSMVTWWSRRSAHHLRADLSIRATSMDVYDFGSPPPPPPVWVDRTAVAPTMRALGV